MVVTLSLFDVGSGVQSCQQLSLLGHKASSGHKTHTGDWYAQLLWQHCLL